MEVDIANLPTGTVTFLFTDIEGSTRQWERDAGEMRSAVDRHHALLAASLAVHGGQVFKTIGDAIQAAFATAPAAVAAAVDAQRALAEEDWPILGGAAGALKVRMAIHTGAAAPVDGDYLAPCLNRLARLVEVAHGGQVLVSLAAAQLARGALPADVALRDLGWHRLRDLLEPEQVFQVLAPGLAEDFPPLRGLDRHPHNLPVALTPLVGRDAEIAAARAVLERPDVRLITLTGPGGVGKTRFALQLAAEMVPLYRDGVFLVPLAPVADPAQVVFAVADTLGVRETGGRGLRESLADWLRGRHLLLLLDNFEHVIEAAPLVSDLLAACPELEVMVTSRELLRLRGEREVPVPPLGLPGAGGEAGSLSQYAAVELFIRRAQEVKPDFQVTNETAPAVAEICARLDGLPLAIELAAARSKLFGPRELLERLTGTAGALEGRALPLLTGGARDAPERQRTLRAAIAWSHDLLSPCEQAVFRRLAAFAGSWSLEMAESVCRGAAGTVAPPLECDVVDAVGTILDKSLLRRAGAGDAARFELLRTIDEFATAELAAAGEEAAVRGAHLAAYLALAETASAHLSGAEQVNWLDRLTQEHDNCRAALTWAQRAAPAVGVRLAAALWRFWFMRGHFSEGRERLAALLAVAGADLPPGDRAAALNGLGALAWAQSDYATAETALGEALALRRAAGDRRGAAAALSNLGAVAFERGRHTESRAMHQEALAIRRELGDRWGVATSLIHLGNLDGEVGRYAEAEAQYAEALAIARELGDQSGQAFALDKLGTVAANRGDFHAAVRWHEQALAAARALGDPEAVGRSLSHLGAVAREQGDYAAARQWLEQGRAIRLDLGDRRGQADSLRELGNVAMQEGDDAAARRLYEESLALARAVGYRESIARTLNNLAMVARAEGDYPTAHALLTDSLAECRALGHRQGEGRVLDNLGMVAAEVGDWTAARRCYAESLDLRVELGDRRGLASALEGVGVIAAADGDLAGAARLWAAAATLRAGMGAPVPLSERERFQAQVERVRSSDPAAFDAAWALGEAMDLNTAVAFAAATAHGSAPAANEGSVT